jgi:hypothetical protein
MGRHAGGAPTPGALDKGRLSADLPTGLEAERSFRLAGRAAQARRARRGPDMIRGLIFGVRETGAVTVRSVACCEDITPAG